MKKTTCMCGPSCACPDCPCSRRATLFDALGNPSRLAILTALRTQPHSVTELTNKTGLEQTAVSHALRRLTSAKLVHAKRQGKRRIYAIDTNGAQTLARHLEEHLLGNRHQVKP